MSASGLLVPVRPPDNTSLGTPSNPRQNRVESSSIQSGMAATSLGDVIEAEEHCGGQHNARLWDDRTGLYRSQVDAGTTVQAVDSSGIQQSEFEETGETDFSQRDGDHDGIPRIELGDGPYGISPVYASRVEIATP